ncbi:NHLP family bacteriocin export ABC transporter peptidase/permease/ATPase subunit [soil metagenome]
MEVVECGAAAIGIVLAYYGRNVSLEELRVICGVSRDGTKVDNLLQAARHYGLEAKSTDRGVDEILAGTFPTIAFWNFNHFVVVEGVSRTRVFLNDPATGPRSVSREEFGKGLTGVTLEFSKGPAFVRGGASIGVMAKLTARLKGFGGAIAFVFWVSLMLVIPGIIVPGITAAFVDRVLIQRFHGWLGPLLIGLAVTFLLNAVLRYLQGRALLRIELRLALEQSARFTWHVLRLPIAFFSQRYLGDLVNRVDANDRVALLLARDIGNAAANCLTAAFLGAVMIAYDSVLAAIVLGSTAFNIVILRLLKRSLSDVALRLQIEQGRLFSTSVVGLQSIETLKSTGGENDFFSKWAGYHARTINSEQELAIYQQTIDLLPTILLSLTSAAVLGIGALHVMDDDLSIGALVAFQSLLINFSMLVQQVVGVAGKVRQAAADLARLDDVLHHERDWLSSTAAGAPDVARVAGRLSMQEVSFGYSPLEPPLIENFSLDVAPGQWVALVGTSGSGKSTVGKLITGLFEPRTGDIRVDGRPLRVWGRERLSTIVGSVDQDIRLFKGTLHDNVTLWDDTVDHALLVAAIDDAGLTPFVRNMPGNFNAVIEEGGRNLNGGGRQRLEIARALVRDPSILVLDEATSALDAESENEILTAVRRRGMTCVLVAHRLSTIRDCDEIIVLERGKVVERGTHTSLMITGGTYAGLIGAEAAA